MTARTLVCQRLSASGIEKLDQIAHEREISRSEVIREALAFTLARPAEFDKHLDKQGDKI